MHAESKRRLYLGNACCHLALNVCLRMVETRMLRKLFGPIGDKVAGG